MGAALVTIQLFNELYEETGLPERAVGGPLDEQETFEKNGTLDVYERLTKRELVRHQTTLIQVLPAIHLLFVEDEVFHPKCLRTSKTLTFMQPKKTQDIVGHFNIMSEARKSVI